MEILGVSHCSAPFKLTTTNSFYTDQEKKRENEEQSKFNAIAEIDLQQKVLVKMTSGIAYLSDNWIICNHMESSAIAISSYCCSSFSRFFC